MPLPPRAASMKKRNKKKLPRFLCANPRRPISLASVPKANTVPHKKVFDHGDIL
jgi:hypothetical protein